MASLGVQALTRDWIYINGGRRGLLLGLGPELLLDAAGAQPVEEAHSG